MPAQLIRRVRGRQPQPAVKIDFANPITRSLSSVIRLDTCAEAVKGKLYTATGTKLQRSSIGTGRGFGSTDGVGTTDKVLTDIVGTQGPRTYFVLAKLNGWGGGNFGRFFEGTTASQELFYVSNAGNGGLLYWRQFSGGRRTALTVDPNSVSNQFGKLTSYSVSFDASSPSNQPELYIAGTRYAYVSLDGIPTGTANSTGAFYIGNRGTDNLRNIDGTIYLVLVFDRMLSAAEHKSLTENPWQVFAPETIPLFWAGVTAQSATASIAAAIRVSNTSTASLSAAIAQRNTATASVSAVIKAGITATASVNAAIQAPRSATASLSAAVRAGQSATASLSAAVRLAAAATASLSAAVRAGQTATASISGAVQVSATATASLSASITAPGALSITASLSAAVRQANAATASIDSAIRAARTASASIDSAITAQRTASASASAAVSVAFSVSASLDSAVQRVAIASASLSAYVQADTTITKAEVDMLADIWRRLGLDIANPLVQGATTLTFGPTITLSGSGTITSTRTGSTDSGPAAGVMLLDVWQRLGLDPANPMTASDTAINAGAVSQTVSESAGTVTVQRA